ncbi:uncharacterized protein LY79DRAFT_579272 [Colletotrichum navitas]|uniref:Uncharacterized protein n=1 Tax=Colletotrichum navitas TaxID=681940 RepID=A0AAD8Q0Y0_9PEZI|nr:uncharacterized protein LY79DRAFT_579272 [Colletotrichum navitas]KAK1593440.1 hypothetical protein LY79DRAFT_579272 [Colletotrichum navitas]
MTSNKGYDWEMFESNLDRAEEIFTIHHLADHVETLARIVKGVYPLVATVALRDTEGMMYGASVTDNLPIWEGFAKSVDVYAPRMLNGNYNSICKNRGVKASQPLLVVAHPQDWNNMRDDDDDDDDDNITRRTTCLSPTASRASARSRPSGGIIDERSGIPVSPELDARSDGD